MGHSFVETDEPLKWNRAGKSYSLNEAKRLINETCLEYIRREYEDKEQEYEWEGDDFWNYASLGDKEGVIVSYFPHLNNKEIEKLADIVYRLDASNAKLNQWLNASDENKDFWRKSKMSFVNLKRMNHVLNESYGPALAIANDEIVWMGGFSREG
jgi:hypothetical protein